MKKSYKIGLLVVISCTVVAVFVKDTPKQKEARYIRRGNEYLDNAEYEKARVEYKNAAKLFPIDPEPYYHIGMVDEAKGDIRNAFANFLQAEHQDPHYHPAVLRIANYLLIAEQYGEMQKRLDLVLTDSPGDPEAHALHAALLLRQKDFVGTEKEATEALEKDPANITAVSVLAGLYASENKLDKAVAVADSGIAHNPKDISLLMLKEKLYENPLNLPKVDETFHQIFKVQPKNAQFHVDLANVYINASKFDQAEATLREGVDMLPDDWYMKLKLCAFLGKYRSTEIAEKEIRGLMSAYPEKDDLYFWLADLYITNHETDKAIALLQQIIDKGKEDKQSLNASTSLARIQFVKGNKDLAQKMVAAVLEKSPSNREALFIRANMRADEGLYEDAVSDLRIILHNQPKDTEALHLLGEVLLLQGHVDLAIETLNQLLDIEPANPAVKVRLAQMYNINGDPKRAKELLDNVTKLDPSYPVAWESLARMAIDKNDVAAARSAIHSLDSIDGQHMTSMYLDGRISDTNGDNEKANADYKKVIDADPSSPLAEHSIIALVNGSKTPETLEATTNYLTSLKTNSTYVSTVIGECYMKLGKFDLASAAFDKAIANRAASQTPYIIRAQLYLKDKKADEALDVLKAASDQAPNDVRAIMMRADILMKLDRYKEVIDIYTDVLKRNPGMDLAANNLSAIIADYEFNDPAMLETARKTAERFASANDTSQLDTLAWIYYRQNRLQDAEAILARLTSSTQITPPDIHYHYGAVLVKLGKTAQAKEELKKATPKDASYHGVEDARKLLESI